MPLRLRPPMRRRRTRRLQWFMVLLSRPFTWALAAGDGLDTTMEAGDIMAVITGAIMGDGMVGTMAEADITGTVGIAKRDRALRESGI